MTRTALTLALQGGDRRSIGKSNQVVARVLRRPGFLLQLIECLRSDDPIVRMRAADAAEKISVKRPDLLASFQSRLLGLAEESIQPELRWHLALMLPRLPLTRAERNRAVHVLRRYLADRSSIVKTFALQGLSDFANGDVVLEAEVVGLLERACRTGTPAMKARGRKLLKRFQAK